jgi:hypothetical protein
MADVNQRPTVPRLFEIVAVALCTVTFIVTALSIFAAAIGHHSEGTRDYVEYWSSGQLLAHGQNPYDPNELLILERNLGLPGDIPSMVMGNAPPALLLAYPLGFVGPKHGEWVWMLLLLGSLLLSVHLIADALETRKSYVKLLGWSFAPALTCIQAGQMALFVLLGVALFLHSYRTRPFVAGAALWLCLLKPQLFLPFGMVLAVWAIWNRQFRIIAGLVIAVVLSDALIWWLDPQCWRQYREMMQLLRYDRADIPCLSIVLRNVAGGAAFVQYLPAAAGCIWAVAYFWRHRFHWNWFEHGSSVLLVSLLVPPYTWFVDQCVAIPALLRGLSVVRSRSLIAVLAMLSALIEAGPYLGRSLMHSKVYLWTAPAWLVWYLFAKASAAGQNTGTITAETRAFEAAEV